MDRLDSVRESSRRASDNPSNRLVGAEGPEPNRLSRNVAPSGLEVVVPGMASSMMELAGTDCQECAAKLDLQARPTSP
jgi:hypothetical protein